MPGSEMGCRGSTREPGLSPGSRTTHGGRRRGAGVSGLENAAGHEMHHQPGQETEHQVPADALAAGGLADLAILVAEERPDMLAEGIALTGVQQGRTLDTEEICTPSDPCPCRPIHAEVGRSTARGSAFFGVW